MKWIPKDCTAGDIIRIKIGSFYHYGIYVNDERIIQFGLPPIPEYRKKQEEIEVCISDINVFSCGNIIEVAEYSLKEKLKKYSNKDVVNRAEEMIGTRGYNVLHNNCEHFVTYCVFNEKRCEPEEEALKKWRERTIFNLYVYEKGKNGLDKGFQSKVITKDISSNPSEAKEKWIGLSLSINHSYKYDIEKIKIRKTLGGEIKIDGINYSILDTDNYTFLLLSNCNGKIEIGRKNDGINKTFLLNDKEYDININGNDISALKIYSIDNDKISLLDGEKIKCN